MGQFGAVRERAREKYEDYVRAGVGLPAVWDDLHNQIFLGDEAFVLRMQARIAPGQALDEVPRIQRRRPAKPLATYRLEHAGNPRLGMSLAYLSGDHAMKEVAVAFGVHYTTVSRAVKEHEARLSSRRDAATLRDRPSGGDGISGQ